MIKRVLFLMLDQLRQDYLSCYGHASIRTPNIDALAARGVRFDNAFVQGTSCGNSRASTYTGRHVRSHGGTWNDIPFELNQWTMADYMAQYAVPTVLLGKTHMRPDSNGLARFGIDPESDLGRHLGAAGFALGERDDGLNSSGPSGNYAAAETPYFDFLRRQGFGGANPWQDWANAVDGDDGRVINASFMAYANRPSRLPAEFSETAYMTDRAIDFIDQAGDDSWCLHLSYIKPHWPYVAPAPYHQMYGPDDVQAVVRSDAELADAHPVYSAFTNSRTSTVWSHALARETVVPAYMGMIRQLDDQIGRLVSHLEAAGLMDSTLIALTSDHGDYLGDHWLGEKDLFHNASARVPLIVVDPRPQADATRGTADTNLVAAIDLLPTFIDAVGGDTADHEHRLEGLSLQPILHGREDAARHDVVFSECDYSRLPVLAALGRNTLEGRLTMAYDGRWKYVHCLGYGPMLFDLQEDPSELHDLGASAGHLPVVSRMKDAMLDWSAGLRNRTALSVEQHRATMGRSATRGILIGFWDEAEVPKNMAPTPANDEALVRTEPDGQA